MKMKSLRFSLVKLGPVVAILFLLEDIIFRKAAIIFWWTWSVLIKIQILRHKKHATSPGLGNPSGMPACPVSCRRD